MGFLKKITRPISRVLDKIVPNEIKPALPFLAAAAPFMAPGIMGIGGNTMLSRALISGGLNLGSQLAQEGSEGDFNALSLALASGIGALSGGGPGKAIGMDSGAAGNTIVRSDATGASKFFADKAASMPPGLTKSGLGALESSANYLSGVGETLRNNPFSIEGLKAAMVPVGQATTDLAIADTRRLNKQQIIDDALGALDDAADSAARASAIRLAMQQYGFTEDEITETIASAGYADGGAVGIMNAKRGLVDGPGGYSGDWITKKSKNWITKKEKFDLADLESLQDDEDEDDNDGIQWIKKKDTSGSNKWIQKKAEGGLMDLGGREMDMRGGGFIPIGKKERADDVPARLSKNEFVMTADAVRAAGGGSVNEGAKRMYKVMNDLEARA